MPWGFIRIGSSDDTPAEGVLEGPTCWANRGSKGKRVVLHTDRLGGDAALFWRSFERALDMLDTEDGYETEWFEADQELWIYTIREA